MSILGIDHWHSPKQQQPRERWDDPMLETERNEILFAARSRSKDVLGSRKHAESIIHNNEDSRTGTSSNLHDPSSAQFLRNTYRDDKSRSDAAFTSSRISKKTDSAQRMRDAPRTAHPNIVPKEIFDNTIDQIVDLVSNGAHFFEACEEVAKSVASKIDINETVEMPDGPLVFIVNHPSNMDLVFSYFLGKRLPNLKMVARVRFNNKDAMRLIGDHFFFHYSDEHTGSLRSDFIKIVKEIRRRIPVVIVPWGAWDHLFPLNVSLDQAVQNVSSLARISKATIIPAKMTIEHLKPHRLPYKQCTIEIRSPIESTDSDAIRQAVSDIAPLRTANRNQYRTLLS